MSLSASATQGQLRYWTGVTNASIQHNERRARAATKGFTMEMSHPHPRVPVSPCLLVRKEVLEVACGTESQMPEEDPKRLVSVDLVRPAVHASRKRAARLGVAGHCSFAAADAFALPFRDESFDTGVCFRLYSTLEQGFEQPLRELLRVVRPGGAVAFTVYGLYHWMHEYRGKIGEELDYGVRIVGDEEYGEVDKMATTETRMARMVRDLGLKKRRIETLETGWVYVEARK